MRLRPGIGDRGVDDVRELGEIHAVVGKLDLEREAGSEADALDRRRRQHSHSCVFYICHRLVQVVEHR
jgi:hypothetical protein